MNPANCHTSRITVSLKDNPDFTTPEPVYVYTGIIKPKIVNSVHSSKESLRPESRSNRLRGSVQEDAMDETELVTLTLQRGGI